MTEMTPAEAIYFAAANLTAADQAAYLAQACAGNADLRQQVERMLAARADVGNFLEPCAPDDITATNALPADPDLTADLASRDEQAGTVLADKYRLSELIGEGGMGSVWIAHQSEPVKRKVAVKLIKEGMDSKQVLARFEAERQALAVMDHPNIAKVLDGGLHEGRPFFVMELVKGVPITEYCDKCKLTPTERLELFVPVCQAIQHAHQKGIIHRDIKPSNVLIALYDDKPVPKVIDFGIAKATGGTLTEHTIETAFGGVVGTPQYMSPEQASLNNLDIDTRSDVYSLGVLLYELLTGSPPFARKELERRGLLEMLRVVREEEPPRPSTKLSMADALPTLSASRGTEPKKLMGLLRSELDWVVMKALEKDRVRRYETANAFAADVQRYLTGEAVHAHPPSAAYRLRKFVRRNKGRVIAAGLVLVALLGGIAGTTLGLVEARRQEREAKAQERIARGETAEKEKARSAEAERVKERDAALKAEGERADELLHQIGVGELILAGSAYDNRDVVLAAERLEKVPAVQRGWEWRYLKQQTRGGIYTLYEPTGAVTCAAYSPDGERIVTGSTELFQDVGVARVWDARTGLALFELKGLKEGVSCVAFSPDGTRIAAVAAPPINPLQPAQKALKVWDVRTGEVQFELKDIGYGVRSVLFSPDGEKLLTGGERVTVWDLRSRKSVLELNVRDLEMDNLKVPKEQRQTLELPHLEAAAMAMSRDGKRLFVCFENGALQVWDAEKKAAPLLNLAGTRYPTARALLCVSLSPDGARLLTGYKDGSATVRDARTGAPLLELRSRTHPESGKVQTAFSTGGRQCASYSPDGTRIVVAGGEGCAYEATVWDARTGVELLVLTGHTQRVVSATFSPDGTRIVTGSDDGTAKVWDAHTGSPRFWLRGDQPEPSVAFSPDGTRVVVGGSRARIWDLRTGAMVRELNGPRALVRCVAFGPDGTRVATAGDGGATVWDAGSGEALCELRGVNQPVNDVSFSPDGARVVTAGIHMSEAKTELKVWDARTGALRIDLTQPAFNVTIMGQKGGSVAFSPDGTRFVTGDVADQREPTVWDAKSGAVLFRLRGLRGPVLCVAYSPDGKRIVAGGQDKTVLFWDAETGEPRPTELRGHSGDVTSVAFNQDQTRIVTGSIDRTVRVWDARTGSTLLELKGLAGAVNRVSFSLDGTSIAAAVNIHDAKSEVIVWDAPPAALTQLTGTLGAIRGTAFSPDGSLLVTCEFDEAVRVWDARTGAMLHDLRGLKPGVRSAEFSPDGTRIVTRAGSVDQVWDGRTGKELEKEAIPITFRGGPVSPDGRFFVHARGPRVEIVSLKPDGAELARRRRHTQANLERYREGVERARAAKDEFAARLYIDLLPAAERPLREAQLAEDLGRKEVAIAMYRKAVELDPRNPDLVVAFGHLLLGTGKGDDALALYLKAVEHEPLVAVRVCPDLQNAGQAEGAVTCCRKALELVPRHVGLRENLTAILGGLGRADEQLAELRKLVELDPTNHHRHAQLGFHLWARGQRNEAFACYMTAGDVEPRRGYHLQVACLQAWFGLDQELAVTRRRLMAMAKAPDGNATRSTAVLANCLKHNADRAERDEALTLARAVVNADKNTGTLQCLGVAEYRCGNYAAAVEALRLSVDIANKSGPGFEHSSSTSGLYLAMALFQQGKKDESRTVATQAAAKMPIPMPKEGEDPQTAYPDPTSMILWLAYKEAKALIGFDAAAARPPNEISPPPRAKK